MVSSALQLDRRGLGRRGWPGASCAAGQSQGSPELSRLAAASHRFAERYSLSPVKRAGTGMSGALPDPGIGEGIRRAGSAR